MSAPKTSAPRHNTVSVAQVLVFRLRVRDAMSRNLLTAAPDASLRAIQNLMKVRRVSGVPITQEDRLLGIITIEDIINALDHGHINEPAERWMTRKPVTLKDSLSLVRAVAEFDRHGFGRLPVVDDTGRLVGIITRGDITSCLMHHLEKRAEEAMVGEAERAASISSDHHAEGIVINTRVEAGDFDNAGRLSQRMRELLRSRGTDPIVRRRAAIIAYEAETNIIIHSVGGAITATIYPDRILVEAEDEGPGIESVELAMQEGWSTAGPLARQLGFGAGMGLPNMKKCSDKFELRSQPGSGTRVHAEVLLRKADPHP